MISTVRIILIVLGILASCGLIVGVSIGLTATLAAPSSASSPTENVITQQQVNQAFSDAATYASAASDAQKLADAAVTAAAKNPTDATLKKKAADAQTFADSAAAKSAAYQTAAEELNEKWIAASAAAALEAEANAQTAKDLAAEDVTNDTLAKTAAEDEILAGDKETVADQAATTLFSLSDLTVGVYNVVNVGSNYALQLNTSSSPYTIEMGSFSGTGNTYQYWKFVANGAGYSFVPYTIGTVSTSDTTTNYLHTGSWTWTLSDATVPSVGMFILTKNNYTLFNTWNPVRILTLLNTDPTDAYLIKAYKTYAQWKLSRVPYV